MHTHLSSFWYGFLPIDVVVVWLNLLQNDWRSDCVCPSTYSWESHRVYKKQQQKFDCIFLCVCTTKHFLVTINITKSVRCVYTHSYGYCNMKLCVNHFKLIGGARWFSITTFFSFVLVWFHFYGVEIAVNFQFISAWQCCHFPLRYFIWNYAQFIMANLKVRLMILFRLQNCEVWRGFFLTHKIFNSWNICLITNRLFVWANDFRSLPKKTTTLRLSRKQALFFDYKSIV